MIQNSEKDLRSCLPLTPNPQQPPVPFPRESLHEVSCVSFWKYPIFSESVCVCVCLCLCVYTHILFLKVFLSPFGNKLTTYILPFVFFTEQCILEFNLSQYEELPPPLFRDNSHSITDTP